MSAAPVNPSVSSLTVASTTDAETAPLREPAVFINRDPEEASVEKSSGRISNSLFALIDQGLVSAGNFLTTVLLARSLKPAEYGDYLVLLDAILFFNTLQSALVIYPLQVRCPSMDKEKLRTFAGTCVALTLLMAIPLGAMMFAYSGFIAELGTARSVAIWAVLGQTFWQCQETVRRTLLARGKYGKALPGDLISYIGQALIIGLLAFHSSASVSYAFMAVAITSLVSCIIQCFQLKVRLTGFRKAAKTAINFWNSGRWVLVGSLSTLISGPFCSYTLLRWHGAETNGQFGAVANLMKPSNPLLIALATLIVPAVALAASRHGPNDLREAQRVTRKHTVHGLMLLMPYWLLLLLFPQHLLQYLYPHRPEYWQLGFEARLLIASYAMTFVNVVVGAMLNGFNRSRRAMAAQLIGSAASLCVTIPLTVHMGLRGLLWGTLVSNTVIAVSLLYLLVRLERHLAKEREAEMLLAGG